MSPGKFDVDTPLKVKKEVFNVVENYLTQPGHSQSVENFVRKIGKNDSYIYNHEVRTYF